MNESYLFSKRMMTVMTLQALTVAFVQAKAVSAPGYDVITYFSGMREVLVRNY